MRFLSLEVEGFRGFAQRQPFDLSADAIVVVGANGNGKTSLFDAILWALSGRLPRIGSDNARLVSMYSDTGQARVELRLTDKSPADKFVVTRSFDGKQIRISLQTPTGTLQGPAAEGRLIDLIWPDAASASTPHEALASAITRSVYLQQDLVRQFVEAAQDHDRFSAVSELVGAGRVTELQVALERGKRAWSTATNQREDELRGVRERLGLIDSRITEITSRTSSALQPVTSYEWAAWWKRTLATLPSVTVPQLSSREAASTIDAAIKQLEAARRSADRRLEALAAATEDLAALDDSPPASDPGLLERVPQVKGAVEQLKVEVKAEQDRQAELRRAQTALKETREQLQALASLALKHLGDACPVCGQEYDVEATRTRLQRLATGKQTTKAQPTASERLPQLLLDLSAREQELRELETKALAQQRAVAERASARRRLEARLREIGVDVQPDGGAAEAISQATRAASQRVQEISALQKEGESLALRQAQLSSGSAIAELRSEADKLRRDMALRSDQISSRQATGERAQKVIEALREAASTVVEERLREIGPLLQSIYARIDPHPSFRAVSFLSKVVRGKGQLSTIISDLVEDKTSDRPASVLSSSQVNALAVSVFLALNIGITNPPLSAAILDDPLQSLDDINLLGVVELFRRTKAQRQLLVSTHDVRFGALLARKLRPIDDSTRTTVIELDGWTRRGPIVSTRDIQCDPAQLRLVNAKAG